MLLKCFPRIHIALMDMGNATARRYGGAGFTLSAPVTEISATVHPSRTQVSGLSKIDADGKNDLLAALARWAQSNEGCYARLSIKKIPTQPIGLGTKTSLVMGALAASTLVGGKRIFPEGIQKLSGRGGASGVGINTFFHGGFIADGGHSVEPGVSFVPSSRRIPTDVPPIVSRLNIPKSWRFHLFLPRGTRFSGNAERQFFIQNTPVPQSEVRESIALLYHGVVPAVATADLGLLKRSLTDLHQIGFKKREFHGQSEDGNGLVRYFSSIDDCAVGLSSMGPLVYVISSRPLDLEVKRAYREFNSKLICVSLGRNKGFEVEQ